MKGFLSFILLFCIILVLLESKIILYHAPDNELIILERLYGLELNLEGQFIEGARIGAEEGFLLYIAANPQKFEIAQAEIYIKEYALNKISRLNSIPLNDFEFEFWCGSVYDFELDSLRKNMLLENKLLECPNCNPISYLSCSDYMDVNFILDIEEGATPQLSSITLGNKKGSFGLSIYSEKFRLSSAIKFPNTKVNLFEGPA